jgi:hypothetical protein
MNFNATGDKICWDLVNDAGFAGEGIGVTLSNGSCTNTQKRPDFFGGIVQFIGIDDQPSVFGQIPEKNLILLGVLGEIGINRVQPNIFEKFFLGEVTLVPATPDQIAVCLPFRWGFVVVKIQPGFKPGQRVTEG